MSKTYRAKIVYDITPLEDGLLEWQDLDETPMTPDELFRYVREELFAQITAGSTDLQTIFNWIDVEVIDD
jgi:hypothetical protein